jgi:hypothetical protein
MKQTIVAGGQPYTVIQVEASSPITDFSQEQEVVRHSCVEFLKPVQHQLYQAKAAGSSRLVRLDPLP